VLDGRANSATAHTPERNTKITWLSADREPARQPRNGTLTLAYGWDGMAAKGSVSKVGDVPNGTHYVKLTPRS
jgi:hypothetical protein